MVAETDYLIKILKESGIRSNVYTSLKKLKQANELQVAGVLRNSEVFGRSGSKKTYTDQQGRRKCRAKLWDRTTSVNVVIADTTEAKVEGILEEFLRRIGKGIEVDRNWADIEIGDVDWVEEEDSILKAKVAVQFEVTIKSGIYEDRDLRPMEIGDIR